MIPSNSTGKAVTSRFKSEELNRSGIQLIFPDGNVIHGVLTVENASKRGEIHVCVSYNMGHMTGAESQAFVFLNQHQVDALTKVNDVFVLKT